MISKLWNIRLFNPDFKIPEESEPVDLDLQIQKQHEMVEKVETILQILSFFEESAAECITEMLANFTNGGYINGAVYAHRLIAHVQVLFTSLEEIDDKLDVVNDSQNLASSKEPKQLIKKIVYFFSVLSSKHDLIERQAATRDMIQLVTSLAHVLKIVIRNALTGALRLEQLHKDTQTIKSLLSRLQQVRSDEYSTFLSHLSSRIKDDHCALCKMPIEEECIKFGTSWTWHPHCFRCHLSQTDLSKHLDRAYIDPSKGLVYSKEYAPTNAVVGAEYIRQLQQYITVLCNAQSKLFTILKIDEKGI
jgi:hypothetical protein